MKIDLKKLTSQDFAIFQEMINLFDAVFENETTAALPPNYLAHLLQQNDFAVWVASIDNQVVGGLTMYILPQYRNTKRMGYLYDIAIKKDCQRKGIGQSLLAACRAWCALNEVTEVFLQAENEDESALNFYRKTGASEIPCTAFDYDIF